MVINLSQHLLLSFLCHSHNTVITVTTVHSHDVECSSVCSVDMSTPRLGHSSLYLTKIPHTWPPHSSPLPWSTAAPFPSIHSYPISTVRTTALNAKSKLFQILLVSCTCVLCFTLVRYTFHCNIYPAKCGYPHFEVILSCKCYLLQWQCAGLVHLFWVPAVKSGIQPPHSFSKQSLSLIISIVILRNCLCSLIWEGPCCHIVLFIRV